MNLFYSRVFQEKNDDFPASRSLLDLGARLNSPASNHLTVIAQLYYIPTCREWTLVFRRLWIPRMNKITMRQSRFKQQLAEKLYFFGNFHASNP